MVSIQPTRKRTRLRTKFKEITYDEIYTRGLKVMDPYRYNYV